MSSNRLLTAKLALFSLLLVAQGCADEVETTGDVTPPTVTITSATTSIGAAYTLTGTVSDDVGVVQLTFNLNDAATDVGIPVAASFSAELTLVNGPNTIRVSALDAANNEGTATITVTAGVNAPPVASDRTVTLDEDTPTDIVLQATDPDEDDLTFEIIDEPEHGTLSGRAPNVTFTPDAEFSGNDSFTFRASDDELDSNVATITLVIEAVNDAPVATEPDADVTTAEDTPVEILLEGEDAEDDDLTFAIDSEPDHGTLDVTDLPTVTYTPAQDYFGEDSFDFVVNDGQSDSAPLTVTLVITPVNDTPDAIEAAVQTPEDTPLPIALQGTDIETAAASLVFGVTVEPSHGTLNKDALPTVVYTPAADYHGPDFFTFEVNDNADVLCTEPGSSCDTATVSITVTPGSIIYVATDGNDANNGLSPGAPKRTIEAAIAAADLVEGGEVGDTVAVADGTYCEAGLVIDRNLSLVGTGMDLVIIDGSMDPENPADCAPPAAPVDCASRATSSDHSGWPMTGVMRIQASGELAPTSPPPIFVEISDLTIRNGLNLEDPTVSGTGSGFGGAIENYEDLTLARVRLSDNCAERGGALANHRPEALVVADPGVWGRATLDSCEVEHNVGIWGGGLYNVAYTELDATSVTDNSLINPTTFHPDFVIVTDPSVPEHETTVIPARLGGGIYSFGVEAVSHDQLTLAGTRNPDGSFTSIVEANRALVGGGIMAEGGHVELSNTLVTRNAAPAGGGLGFAGAAIADILGSSLDDNRAFGGGGIAIAEDSQVSIGPLLGESEEILHASTIDGNTGTWGVGVQIQGGVLELFDTSISGNLARERGAGLAAMILGHDTIEVEIHRSTIEGNVVRASLPECDPADPSVDPCCQFCLDRSAGEEQNGGGIYVAGASSLENTIVDIFDSEILGNEAADLGAGLYVETAVVTLTKSTIAENLATSEDDDNSAETGDDATPLGGGLYVASGDVDLLNSTVSTNVAETQGSAIYTPISLEPAVSLSYTTVYGNSDYSDSEASALHGVFTIWASVIANNTPTNCAPTPPVPAPLKEASYTLTSDNSCDDLTDVTNILNWADTVLVDLAENGGPTLTHAPSTDSKLIDNGPPVETGNCVDSDGAVVDLDQRGSSRPVDGNADGAAGCDIGAVEAP